MPRTATDFSGMDPGEVKNLSYGFGTPGQSTSPLAAGETVTSVAFQMSVISGNDSSPTSRLIGSPVVQPGGLSVTQMVGTLQPGAIYEIAATVSTSASQTLTPYSHLPCNPIS
jgi:hypothetical protein